MRGVFRVAGVIRTRLVNFLALATLAGGLLAPLPAAAQIVEAVGSQALGMGGAFVAVADDSTATWWNPGALAAGPFVDVALARTVTDSSEQRPAGRDSASYFAIGTPPFGFSYYRLRITQIDAPDPTVADDFVRQEELGGAPVRSLAARQLGVTLVQTLIEGVHAGTTVKWVRGSVHQGLPLEEGTVSDLLDFGSELEGGDTRNAFDLDVGLMAVAGPVRLGAVVRNLREPEFGGEDGLPEMRLPRQARAGIAFDGAQMGTIPVTVALDADLSRYPAASGDRRIVAMGAEAWLFGRRVGLRGGGRFNTVGAEERAATAGISVGLRSGLYLDGHLVRGGADDEQGWGVATRVTF